MKALRDLATFTLVAMGVCAIVGAMFLAAQWGYNTLRDDGVPRYIPTGQDSTPTTQDSQLVYLAHCDGATGHYRLVVTDSPAVANSEVYAGYWPIPYSYYVRISQNINTLTCVPGPMDMEK